MSIILSKTFDKIGFTATHGAGKTTSTKLLASSLQLPAITYSRPTAAANDLGYAQASDVPPGDRQLFQWMGVFEQIGASKKYKRAVLDRTEVEFWAYWELETRGRERDEGYEAICRFYAQRYDVIFYLPPNSTIPPEANGKRYVTHTLEIDELILEGIERFGLQDKVYKVESDNPYDRLEEMHAELRRRGFVINPLEVRL